MFNTYIYGTPLGFDFYEDVVSLKEYFKGLYISSRKGRRLMVNRRDNGETFYNYLRYGLAEKGGRPNSFFGMSISMDNNEYAYDFKEIFDWFDYLFDKLVDRGSLFYVNAGNVIQYRIAKFKDNLEEVQWLKNNIPNLFTKAQGTKLLEYDSSFSALSSGQIRCFNDETTTTKVWAAFKKCRWIALSPNFKHEEEPIEIDPADIEAQLNKYTQQLVTIAISPRHENLNVLHSIESNCIDTIGLIQKYLATVHDDSEQRNCAVLIEKAQEIVTNAKTIANKIGSSHSITVPFSPEPSLKICKRCGRDLPLANFSSVNSQYCMDCENKIHQPKSKTKKCSKCGKVKNQTEFPGGSSICYDCKRHKSILDYIDSKELSIAVVILLISGISLYLVFGGDKSSKDDGDDSLTDEVVINDEEFGQDSFDANKFSNFLISKEFKKAYNYIEDKENNEIYISQLKASIEQHLWEILDSVQLNDIESSVRTFFLYNRSIVTNLNIYEEEWVSLADIYSRLLTYAKSSKLSRSQKTNALELVEKLPDNPSCLKETWRDRISAIPLAGSRTGTAATDASGKHNSALINQPTIILVDPSNPNGLHISKSCTKSYPDGTIISITSSEKITISKDVSDYVDRPNGDQNSCSIKVSIGKTQIVTTGDITITVTAKANGFKTINK